MKQLHLSLYTGGSAEVPLPSVTLDAKFEQADNADAIAFHAALSDLCRRFSVPATSVSRDLWHQLRLTKR